MPPKPTPTSLLCPQGQVSFLKTQKLPGIRAGGRKGNFKDWKLTPKSLKQAKEIALEQPDKSQRNEDCMLVWLQNERVAINSCAH